ncbi:flavin-containing monooxygenase FMO GS-OX-like 4 isoform X2 [Papaver somniferum]|uniref:flavin-containing monooxygenase FMO GS-OX-like 4 isoform X2 n=1 Tax=Papaver somniferum TaxID=3469 RepID=UPI000E6F80E0|nr:flavin-containing monooxygenase FMO GS-OX-like 4 isoform X2 [Papaver somniferum]
MSSPAYGGGDIRGLSNPLISTMNSRISSSLTSRNVAVIGAGAAGLVAARELRREGHKTVVFERSNQIGGTWVYDPNIESDDPLGLNPSRNIIHTSLYKNLRTNLPRESMGFRDYPFVTKDGNDQRDNRRYPGHKEVLNYLEDFANDFKLIELIRFETEVFHVGLLKDDDKDGKKWVVRSAQKMRGGAGDGEAVDEVFDGVVVCNGHYTEPNIAEIPGIDEWPGKQMHSHNYRVPEPFLDQVVVVIGTSASGQDISRDIAEAAKEVHIAGRSLTEGVPTRLPGHENMWLHSMIESAHDDGRVIFQDGSSVTADVILHCTGYKYHFPFLETNNIVIVDENRVGPLYKHVFPPLLAPGLSFIGLPWKVIPFPLSELQSKWVAGVLSGRISLPSQEEMMADVEAFYLELEAAGLPKRFTHNMSDYQFEYGDWLAAQCGCTHSEKWRKLMYYEASKKKRSQPETYRDEWEAEHLILEAYEYFRQCIPTSVR